MTRRSFPTGARVALRASLGLLVAASAAGCVFFRAAPHQPRAFLLVPREEAPALSNQPRFSDSVEVRGFTSPRRMGKYFATLDRSTGELRQHPEYQWADKPDELATSIVAARLHAAGLFEGVRQQSSGHRPRYSMGGRVRAFRFETPRAGANDVKAVFELELSLLDTIDGEQVWWADLSRRVVVTEPDSPESMSAAMAEAAAMVADEVARQLAAVEYVPKPRAASGLLD
jgi:ABC-type uncharacterized transport system auxiliary subunit